MSITVGAGEKLSGIDDAIRASRVIMSYRDDVDALRARHAALEAQVSEKLTELEPVRARHVALDAELAGATRERDDVRRLIDQVRLPLLDNVEIASPCRADWDAMTGDDRVRRCHGCDKQVFNLTAMTRYEATTLVRDKAGQLCVRYYQRADGTILLADCTIGRRRRRIGIAAGALLAAGAGLAVAAQLTLDERPVLATDEPAVIDESALADEPIASVPEADRSHAEKLLFEHGAGFSMGMSRALEFTTAPVEAPKPDK